MRHRISATLIFLVQCVTIGLALAFVIGLLWPAASNRLRTQLGLTQPPGVSAPITTSPANPTPAKVEAAPESYASAVQKAAPAVVNIYANKIVTERRVRLYPDPLMRRLFGGIAFGPAYKRREQSLGSGVIFSKDGYILTNNHVIAGADDIKVLLHDNRVAHATVVGTDALTDLAVLKIDAKNLPSISVADQEPLQVGDVVLAIGNPFGIGQTVTMGIVSGLQRQLSRSTYENFIQTDAAINAGNSGGALINADGELVGINTAMLGRRTGAEGIGFAIPVGTAREVMRQIIEHGRVIRGWIGANYRAVTADLGSGLPAPTVGVMVVNVYPASPAAQAGFQPGDILLRLNDQPIPSPAWLRAQEADLQPGTRVTLSGLRDGRPIQFTVTLTERPRFPRQQQGARAAAQ